MNIRFKGLAATFITPQGTPSSEEWANLKYWEFVMLPHSTEFPKDTISISGRFLPDKKYGKIHFQASQIAALTDSLQNGHGRTSFDEVILQLKQLLGQLTQGKITTSKQDKPGTEPYQVPYRDDKQLTWQRVQPKLIEALGTSQPITIKGDSVLLRFGPPRDFR